jgi:uncharacterized protein with von Willebrand factor type A (vWA) domain
LLARLALLAAAARRAKMGVSVEQLATLVRGLEAMGYEGAPVLGRDELKRLVGLTLATSKDDVAVLWMLVDALFPAPEIDVTPRLSDETGSGLPDQLQDALTRGDIGAGARVGEMIAALAGQWPGITGRGRLEQRVLRAFDLSAMLAKALSDSRDADGLERQLTRIARDATLASLQGSLHSELMRRELLARTESADSASTLDLSGLFDELAGLPLAGGRRSDQERLRAAVRPLATRLAARARRRRRGGRRQLDVRRTLRRSIATGGAPMELRFRSHRPHRPQIVVLADVSGSMVDYASFTMSLLQALHDELPALRCFAFVDGVGEVTKELLASPAVLGAQLPMIPGVVSGDGRSDYGSALEAFERLSAAVLTTGTSLVIIGDGRSRAADPGDQALRRLSYRVRHLYWLTPEDQADWASDDCRMAQYERWCERIDTVSTVGQLEAWVERVISGR